MRIPLLLLTHGFGAAMCGRRVLVHCPSCLRAAVSVLAAEIPCGDGVFAKRARKRAKAVHHFDGVMSHNVISAVAVEPCREPSNPKRPFWFSKTCTPA